MVDVKDMEFHVIAGEKIPRPQKSPTPCFHCPKCAGEIEKSPRIGRESELSKKNWQTLELYFRAQACGGSLPGMDELTRRNFGLIRSRIDAHNMAKLSSIVEMLPLLRGRF